jgi:uncharacterized protein YndB with AHSA1/START domain
MRERIYHQFFYDHSPETVWEYLTKAELISQWLMPNDFLPIVGHDFRFTIRAMPEMDFDGIVYCKIVELIPFKRLSYSWKLGPGGGKIAIDSLVSWTLIPKDGGTELTLDHTGVKEMEYFNMFSALNKGWEANMKKIGELIHTSTHGTPNT